MTLSQIKAAVKDSVLSVLLKFGGGPSEAETAELKAQEKARESIKAETKATLDKIAALEAQTKVALDKVAAMEAAQGAGTFKAGLDAARDSFRITPADAKMYLALGGNMTGAERKVLLDQVSARIPNRILSQLSAPPVAPVKVNASGASSTRALDRAGAPADPVHEKAVEIMEADASGKITYEDALNMVYAEQPDLGELLKGDGDGSLNNPG